jgi:RNA polymerase sigma factor (sigma-70 family)
LSSPNSQIPDSNEKSDSPQTRLKRKWSLTNQAFNKLLDRFAPDRDEAAREYERVRQKLIRYFEWRTIRTAEDCADETFNRVARQINEGKQMDDFMAYTFGVARRVALEVLREQDKESVAFDETLGSQLEPVPDPVEPDERVCCFDNCLEKLTHENRRLILEYYQEERRAKIQLRQQIAERLSIPLNALRIRVHRIRISLEGCITHCLETGHVRNE